MLGFWAFGFYVALALNDWLASIVSPAARKPRSPLDRECLLYIFGDHFA
jgi:hypothetical protein